MDRAACAKYKKALDKYLPPEYSEVVFTGTNNDTAELKTHHIDQKKEKQVRKDFAKAGKLPKILIVTEKLLTGYDAPVLYAMYLDKPMRDHTLLQAIARVNRPYEVDEGNGRESASRTASCSTSSASSTSWRRRWRSTATKSTRS